MNKAKKIRLTVLVTTLIIMAIIGTPLHGHAAVDPCSATLSPDLILTMPEVYYNDTFYSVVMQVTGTPDTTGGFYETEITSMQPMTPNCSTPVVVSDDNISTILQMPSLLFGSDDYSVELEYVSTVAGAIVSARRMAAAVNPRIRWIPRKIQLNKGVWRGSATCVYNAKTILNGITSTQVNTTYASATFACPNPILGMFGCIPLADTGDSTATWKLVSGSILYTVEASASGTSGGSSCITTLNGQKIFPMKTPDLGDGLIITSKASAPNVLFYSGSGRQNVPAYKARQIADCAGVHLETVLDFPNDVSDWLGFPPPDNLALDSGNATVITGKGEVTHISLPELTSSLTCDWNFSFIP